MRINRDYLETFEIGNDFMPRGLRMLVEEGIEAGKILPFDLEEIIKTDPFPGYQIQIHVVSGDQKKTFTLEYRQREQYFRGVYVSVPNISEITQEEIDNFDLNI